MNQKEIKDLIEFLIEKEIAEFELERGDVKLRIKRTSDAPVTHYVQQAAPVAHVAPTHVTPASPAAAAAEVPVPKAEAAAPAADDKDLFTVKSPIVGTYYEAPSPG